jgi:LPS export ABC transporter protein LptC
MALSSGMSAFTSWGVIGGLILVWAFAACTRNETHGLPPPTSARTKSQEALLEGVRIDRYENDRLRYHVNLVHASLDRETDVATGEGVEIEVLEKDTSALKARITAPRGKSALRSKVIDLWDGVVMKDVEGRTLKGDAMTYDAASDRLTSQGPVTLEGDNFRAVGVSLSGQPQKGVLDVAPPVRAHIEPRHPPLRR